MRSSSGSGGGFEPSLADLSRAWRHRKECDAERFLWEAMDREGDPQPQAAYSATATVSNATVHGPPAGLFTSGQSAASAFGDSSYAPAVMLPPVVPDRKAHTPPDNHQQQGRRLLAPSKKRKQPPTHGMGGDDDDEDDEEDGQVGGGDFMTGRDKLVLDQHKKNKRGGGGGGGEAPARSLGLKRSKRKFRPPFANDNNDESGNAPSFVKRALNGPGKKGGGGGGGEDVPEELKGCDPKLVEMIQNEMMERAPGIGWDDIAGLEFAKKSVMEIVVWPLKRPDLFKGLRGPPKGLLLFGPPGTGKTLIGKAIASESGASFFAISASSLTSKWHGEGEKLVRTLFAVATYHQPSVIFIDEIDSLLSQRSDSEFEGSRRLKTEFLVQLDGAKTQSEDRVLLVGATNRPQELDEAARRRLVKKLYIPLPDDKARRALLFHLLKTASHSLSDADAACVVAETAGYSGADMHALCTEAAYGPIRALGADISNVQTDQVRPIQLQDFRDALQQIRPSVSEKDLESYVAWNRLYGSFDIPQKR